MSTSSRSSCSGAGATTSESWSSALRPRPLCGAGTPPGSGGAPRCLSTRPRSGSPSTWTIP
eukprot:1465425-Alexandrium_andersonii.AAC.1